jgi:hypothetical protein
MLHVYTDDTDWVVAESAKDAEKAWEEDIGDVRDDATHAPFEPEPDDKQLTVWSDEPNVECGCRAKIDERNQQIARKQRLIDKLPRTDASAELYKGLPKPLDTHPNGHLKDCPVGSKRQTCAEWAKEKGRGFLASTEY